MPCYLTGALRITNFERLQGEAVKLGINLQKEGNKIQIYKDNRLIGSSTEQEITRGSSQLLKEITKQYAINQVRLSAQKKGWKVKSIKEEDGKIRMRLSQ